MFFGPGGTAASYGIWANIAGEQWDLTLAPGQTQNLMWFIQFNDSLAGAQAGTSTFDNLNTLNSAGLLAGLSPNDLGNTVNWAAASVPEPTSLALFGLGGLGVFAARRKRSAAKG